jgi:putative polyketide hydroxylase
VAADLGVAYSSPAIPPRHARREAAEPGERAPHAWVELDGRRMSTLDLFDGRLTVLTGHHGLRWHQALTRLAATGLPIKAYTVGQDLFDPDGELTSRYVLDSDAAVLVRPDGYLAWRGEALQELPAAVAASLGRVENWIGLAS